MRFDQIVDDRLRATLAENFVLAGVTIRRGITRDLERVAAQSDRRYRNVIEFLFGFRRESVASDSEVDRLGRLDDKVINCRNSLIRGIYSGDGGISRFLRKPMERELGGSSFGYHDRRARG